MTNSHLNRDSAVMMSSTTPSAKYSCSGSPLMFVNGRTAMEGLSGSGSGFGSRTLAARSGQRVDPNWASDVLDLLLAPALELNSDLPFSCS